MSGELDEKGLEAAMQAMCDPSLIAGGIDVTLPAAIRAYLTASPSPSMEMGVVAWDRLRDLIGEYFDLGYAEGVVQRDADTMAGDAERTLSEIEGIISQAQSALAAMRAERDSWRRVAEKLEGEKRSAEAARTELAAQVQRLTEENEALRKERDHWKANHAEMVQRNAVLRERPDLPADRLPSIARYEARIKAHEEALTRIASIKYGKPNTLYAQRTVIEYARDQASRALKENAL